MSKTFNHEARLGKIAAEVVPTTSSIQRFQTRTNVAAPDRCCRGQAEIALRARSGIPYCRAMPRRLPRLFHLMTLAQHRLQKSTDGAFKDALGISTTQLGVLFLLEHTPGAMPKDVSEGLGINASAITALIDRMEEAGLVRREASEQDGRAVCLFATAVGLAKAARARPILARFNARLTRNFNDREIETINRFLNAILDRF